MGLIVNVLLVAYTVLWVTGGNNILLMHTLPLNFASSQMVSLDTKIFLVNFCAFHISVMIDRMS